MPPLLLQLLPQGWRDTVGPYVPMESGNQIYIAVQREAAALGPWTGLGVFGIYVAVAVVAGLLLVNHRDA